MLQHSVLEADGKQLEAEMNAVGPGEAYFVQCDVNKEEDIKVCNILIYYYSSISRKSCNM